MKVSELRDVLKPGSEVVISYENDKGFMDDIKISVNMLQYETWLNQLKVKVVYVSQYDHLIHVITEPVAKENK